MSSQTNPHPIVPQLIVDGAARAIEFYVRGLGAVEVYRLSDPSGRVGHAELTLEGAPFTLADEHPEVQCVAPQPGGSSHALTVYVNDVDSRVAQAVAAGAIAERPIADEFYGERVGWIRDPFGHRWSFHTIRENVSAETIKQRYAKLMEPGSSA